MSNMVHLHLHSAYSILDSCSKPKDIVKRISEYGGRAVAITEHGNIASVPEMYNECKKRGIKFIPGMEAYHVEDASQHKEEAKEGVGKKTAHHLILLAMNDTGWTNIKLLNTEANKKFYYVPRIDYADLKKHHEGIICLTACLKGIVPYNLSVEQFDEAARHAKILKSIFEDRFYLEVQDGGLDIQPKVNAAMRALGKQLEIPIVGCQDAHYVDRNDVEAHEAIWAMRTGDTFDKPVGYGKGKEFRPYYSTREYWLKDLEHMIKEPLTTDKGEQRYSDLLQEEIERSMEIAERIGDVKIEKKMHLPRYEFIPDIKEGAGCATKDSCHHELDIGETKDLTSFNYLLDLVISGYEVRYKRQFFEATEEHKNRLRKELVDIKDAGLADYFLIVWDVISWAKSKQIPYGPGRGSAAGSMVSYCLGITEIDPLEYDLIWERFFNRGRIGSLADIDLDFSMERREEIVEYIRKRFGENRVAQMVTFNTMATKAVLKDTAKVLGSKGMKFEDANLMTRHMPHKPKNLSDAVARSDKLQEYERSNPRLFDIARKLEGCPKSSGKHAAGIIISDEPFESGSVPLRWDAKKKMLITEWDGKTMDDMGFVKLDVLGIKTFDVLDDIRKSISGRNLQNSMFKKW